MAKTKASENATPEQKLRALYDLQVIDMKIDDIRTLRGELPLEVEDLEDDIVGLDTRVERISEEIKELEAENLDKKRVIDESKAAIKKYEEQQKSVRNNREYDALSKEIEYQGLEVQLSEKRIKEGKAKLSNIGEVLTSAKVRLEERQDDLNVKKSELDKITSETQREEEILENTLEDTRKKVDSRLLRAYDKIRSSAKNGLAVVPVEREASGGSFIKIPPQQQIDIAQRKRIIIDEHSGRILVDKDLADEQYEKMEKTIAKLLK